MTKYRAKLPQLSGGLFLTDGGLETTLIFHDGIDLPHFAAFDLLREPSGVETLNAYFRRYASIAKAAGVGFIFESPTWRASPDWGFKLGYSEDALATANRESIVQLAALRKEFETDQAPMVISGCVGPRGDGYDSGDVMTVAEAEDYHAVQVGTFSETAADMVTGITMTNANEAVGLARAAKSAGVPVVISFTVETDGHLPTGQSLQDAIKTVDAATNNAPAYYMINCAHPTHFDARLPADEGWMSRIQGLRANASRCSHAELDEATELDDGNPAELGSYYRNLLSRHSHINVLGGCCGTDHRHVEQISVACRDAA